MTEVRLQILRLDDACPTMDSARWQVFETILRKYDVKPIVAVCPNNVDPFLVRQEPDPDFWPRVREWQANGWHIAMHGYRHEALSRNRGLVPLHVKSEFAGVPYAEQSRRIRESLSTFRTHGVEPTLWVAPFHTFDANTLRALSHESSIRIVSDGISRLPYSRLGFFWLPQQLWFPQRRGRGVWTTCFHPNATDESTINALESLIVADRPSFDFDLPELMRSFSSRRRGLVDCVHETLLVNHRRLQQRPWFQSTMKRASRIKRFVREVSGV